MSNFNSTDSFGDCRGADAAMSRAERDGNRYAKNKRRSYESQARRCASAAECLDHGDAMAFSIKWGLAENAADYDEKVRSVEDQGAI